MSSAHIEPVDDGTPNKTSGTIGHDVEANAFAKAINKIVKDNYSSSKPKLWEPDLCDGSNSPKLRTFILQCKLNFQDCPDLFQDDTVRSIIF